MPQFLLQASYTAEGHKGLVKDKASGRKAAVSRTVEKLGGKLEAMYFCFGESDVVMIANMPDAISAAALCSAAASSGMSQTKTTLLLTVDETDAALSKTVEYRGPGA